MEDKKQQQTIQDYNSKIFSITELIRQKYPELLLFLNEMPVTIPNEETPDITANTLKKYYNSLEILLNDYLAEKK